MLKAIRQSKTSLKVVLAVIIASMIGLAIAAIWHVTWLGVGVAALSFLLCGWGFATKEWLSLVGSFGNMVFAFCYLGYENPKFAFAALACSALMIIGMLRIIKGPPELYFHGGAHNDPS